MKKDLLQLDLDKQFIQARYFTNAADVDSESHNIMRSVRRFVKIAERESGDRYEVTKYHSKNDEHFVIFVVVTKIRIGENNIYFRRRK